LCLRQVAAAKRTAIACQLLGDEADDPIVALDKGVTSYYNASERSAIAEEGQAMLKNLVILLKPLAAFGVWQVDTPGPAQRRGAITTSA
jgi:hypothetical protein